MRPWPTLLLLSDDEALTDLVLGIVKQPWKLVRQGADRDMSRKVFTQPHVRLVIFDDQVVEENDRNWLLAKIRKYFSGAPLLYVAGSQSDRNEKRARSNGAQYYVTKPLSLERFGHVLQSFLHAQNAKGSSTHPAEELSAMNGQESTAKDANRIDAGIRHLSEELNREDSQLRSCLLDAALAGLRLERNPESARAQARCCPDLGNNRADPFPSPRSRRFRVAAVARPARRSFTRGRTEGSRVPSQVTNTDGCNRQDRYRSPNRRTHARSRTSVERTRGLFGRRDRRRAAQALPDDSESAFRPRRPRLRIEDGCNERTQKAVYRDRVSLCRSEREEPLAQKREARCAEHRYWACSCYRTFVAASRRSELIQKVRDKMFPLGPDREIAPGASALDAMHKMNEADSGRLVVVDGGKWWDLSPAPGRAYRADEGAAREALHRSPSRGG